MKRHRALSHGIGLAVALVIALAQPASALLPIYAAKEVLFSTGGPQPQETATADFNCDGLMDVVWVQGHWTDTTTAPFRIFLSDGKGGFSDGASQVITGTAPTLKFPRKLLVEDFNGDGRADVFVADFGRDLAPWPGYQNSLLLSTPDCRLVNGTAGLPQQLATSHSATAADIDGDDDFDLFVSTGGGQPWTPAQMLLNDGAGRFSVFEGALPPAQTDLTKNMYTTSLFVDVDADGDPDLVLGGQETTPTPVVLLNDGMGSFSELPNALPPKPWAPTDSMLDFKPLDLNHDGRLDLIAAATKGPPNYYVGRWLQVLVNNGNGTFRDETAQRMPQSDNSNTWFKYIEIVDIDGDSHLDVVGRVPYRNAGGDHRFEINNGSGVFTPVTLLAPSSGLDGVFAFVDLFANGHRDFVSLGEVFTYRVRNTGPVLPPGPPQSVRATRSRTDRVRLSWPYVWGAKQYEIWRSSTDTGAGSLVGTTTALTFDDLAATSGEMFYSVRAVNSAGPGGFSAPRRGALGVPIAPTFSKQPSPQTAPIGGRLLFTAHAVGTPAPTYQWQVSSDGGASWSNVANGAHYAGATTPALLVTVAPATLNGARYRGVAVNSLGSATSAVATATLTTYLPFTDDTLVARTTPVRAVHLTELRARIDAVRAGYRLPPYGYTSAIVPRVAIIRAAHVLETRVALSQAYAAAGLPPPTFNTSPAAGGPIVSGDIMQLRAALVVIEPMAASLFDFMGGLSAARKGVRFQGADFPLGNGAVVDVRPTVAGGVSRTGIFIHPPWQGQLGGETFVEYSVPVPPRAFLQFSVGVADDATCTDGVTFRVTAAGTELWRDHITRTGFHDVVLRLDAYGGAMVPIRIISNPGPANNPNCDWPLWSRLALGSVP